MIGSVGVVAGAATSMATGDINNLWKGATVGAAAGNKMGANLASRGESFLADFGNEVNAEWAANDPDRKIEVRREEARQEFQETFEEMEEGVEKEELKGARDKFSPWMNFNGNVKLLKAANEIDKGTGFTNLQDKLDAIEEAQMFTGLETDSDVEENYMRYLVKKMIPGHSNDTKVQANSYLNDPANRTEVARIRERIRWVKKAQGKLNG